MRVKYDFPSFIYFFSYHSLYPDIHAERIYEFQPTIHPEQPASWFLEKYSVSVNYSN